MNYYIRRTAQAVITLASGMFITYALYRLIPGGPMEAMIADIVQRMMQRDGQVSTQEIQRRVEQLANVNPDTGIIMGFVEYMDGVIFHQHLGESLSYRDPVIDLLFRAMPWSIFISVYGLILGFSATVLVGVLMAHHEGTKLDSSLTVMVLILNSIPYYVGAILMLIVLGYQWELLPTGGRYASHVEPGFNPDFMVSVIEHALMPIGSAFVVGFAAGSLHMRSLAIRIIGEDYLRSAKIRGLGTNRILTRYLTRNSILPIYTGLMIGIAGLFSSSVITEQIFQYPGVGWYLFEALVFQDYPLIMGAFLFFTSITVTGIFIADLTYGLIDPRAGNPAERESY